MWPSALWPWRDDRLCPQFKYCIVEMFRVISEISNNMVWLETINECFAIDDITTIAGCKDNTHRLPQCIYGCMDFSA